ncbi:MAG: hypothetical protein ABFD13_03470 [Candidatus Cryosericum sp.]|nr:hypothetical protein [bacterium]
MSGLLAVSIGYAAVLYGTCKGVYHDHSHTGRGASLSHYLMMQAYWLFSYGEVTSGSVSLNGTLLEEGDQARVSSQSRALSLASATGGSFVLVDVAAWRAADRSY